MASVSVSLTNSDPSLNAASSVSSTAHVVHSLLSQCSAALNLCMKNKVPPVDYRKATGRRIANCRNRIRVMCHLSPCTLYLLDLLNDTTCYNWQGMMTLMLQDVSFDATDLFMRLRDFQDIRYAFVSLFLSDYVLLDRVCVHKDTEELFALMPSKDLEIAAFKGVPLGGSELPECYKVMEEEMRKEPFMLVVHSKLQTNILQKLCDEYQYLRYNLKSIYLDGRTLDYKTSTKSIDFLSALLVKPMSDIILTDLKSHVAHCLALRLSLLKMYCRGWDAVGPCPELADVVRYYLIFDSIQLDNLSPARPMKKSQREDLEKLLNLYTKSLKVMNCTVSYDCEQAIGKCTRNGRLQNLQLQNVYVEGDIGCVVAHMFCGCKCFGLRPFDRQTRISLTLDTTYSRIADTPCMYSCSRKERCVLMMPIGEIQQQTIFVAPSPLVKIHIESVLLTSVGFDHLAKLIKNCKYLTDLKISNMIVTSCHQIVSPGRGFGLILEALSGLRGLVRLHIDSVPMDDRAWATLVEFLSDCPSTLEEFTAVELSPLPEDRVRQLKEIAKSKSHLKVVRIGKM